MSMDMELPDVEARFKECCRGHLFLDERTSDYALQLFRETKSLMKDNSSSIGNGTAEEIERVWITGTLFIVKKLDKSTNPIFTLSQLLRVTKMSVVDFFKEVPQFLSKSRSALQSFLPQEWERSLQIKEEQANYIHVMFLCNYYKRIYPDYFTTVTSEGSNEVPLHMRFGWLLFLAIRMHVLGHFPDLVTCTNALLAVLVIMIVHMPVSLRNFTLDNRTLFSSHDAEGVNVIASISNLRNAFEEDVSRMVESAYGVIRRIFPNIPVTEDLKSVDRLAGFSTEGLMFFDGLMDSESNVQFLEDDYEHAYTLRGDLDERASMYGGDGFESLSGAATTLQKFDNTPPSVQGPAASSQAAPSSPSVSPEESAATAAAAPPSPSISKMPPPTPVSVTMTTAKWLRTVIAPLSGDPSPLLDKFFSVCDYDVKSEVEQRLKLLLDGVFSVRWKMLRNGSSGAAAASGGGDCGSTGGMSDTSWAEQRRMEARKLYYRVLEKMCRSETVRLRTKNLTIVLSKDRFHRCLIACAAELVLAAHMSVMMTFPALLEPTGVAAYDLSKVIESFVRHEETLPRELKRHLNSIEEKILESMAWEPSSSMFNSLIVARPIFAKEIHRLNLLPEPTPSNNITPPLHQVKDEPASPDRESSMITSAAVSEGGGGAATPLRRRSLQSPQRPSSQGCEEMSAETIIATFFQKVLKLAANRLKIMCERLQQVNVVEPAFRLVQHALINVTNMFFNRHLDQIILCSIYGVCKVMKLTVTFKDIITVYRKQPQCKSHVFRNVFIDLRRGGAGHECGDIIKFYNAVFVPAVKTVLINLTPSPSPSPTPPPQLPSSSSLLPAPSTSTAGAGAVATTATTTSAAAGMDVDDDDDDDDADDYVDDDGDDNDDDDGMASAIESCPESPKVGPSTSSAFPSLPDMSPKKVSAKHNVFVSPLRSTKVENIMSPHSRSLYACVGESTHAYQSPSKDLAAINNRLNNSYRRMGRLDFDDATMASASASASAAATTTTTAPSPAAAAPPPAVNDDEHHTHTHTHTHTHPHPSPSPPSKRPRLG